MHRSLVVLALVLGATPLAAQPTAEAPHVVVTGSAEVAVAPDRAVLLLAVESRASTAAAAGADNARRSQVVRAVLERHAGAGRVLSTGYSVQPNVRMDDGRQWHDGYTASNLLRLETRQLDAVGGLIDAALAAGADRIHSVQFSASDPSAARRSALAQAIAGARRDAEAMAAAAGATLGPLVEMSTERFDGAPGVAAEYLRVRGAGSTPTSLTPGEISVQARVLTRWRLVPRG
jgi:hypothetical protein